MTEEKDTCWGAPILCCPSAVFEYADVIWHVVSCDLCSWLLSHFRCGHTDDNNNIGLYAPGVFYRLLLNKIREIGAVFTTVHYTCHLSVLAGITVVLLWKWFAKVTLKNSPTVHSYTNFKQYEYTLLVRTWKRVSRSTHTDLPHYRSLVMP